MRIPILSRQFALYIVLFLSASTRSTTADDQPQWGQRYTRNMVSEETNLPESFDPENGENLKWVVSLGTQSPEGRTEGRQQGRIRLLEHETAEHRRQLEGLLLDRLLQQPEAVLEGP